MELEKRGDGERVLDVGRVSPGGQYTGIAALTNRLRLLGDLPDSVTISSDSKSFMRVPWWTRSNTFSGALLSGKPVNWITKPLLR
jgi:hypothetical protein